MTQSEKKPVTTGMVNLTSKLEGSTSEFLIITFSELEEIICRPLSKKEKQSKWWSNKATNKKAKIWLDAGYIVFEGETIEIRKTVIFKRHTQTKKEQIAHKLGSHAKSILGGLLSIVIIPYLLQVYFDARNYRNLLCTIETAYSMHEYDEVESLIIQNIGIISKSIHYQELLEVYDMLLDSLVRTSKDALLPIPKLYDYETISRLLSISDMAINYANEKQSSRFFLRFCYQASEICCCQYASTMDIDYLVKARNYIKMADDYQASNLSDYLVIEDADDYALATTSSFFR